MIRYGASVAVAFTCDMVRRASHVRGAIMAQLCHVARARVALGRKSDAACCVRRATVTAVCARCARAILQVATAREALDRKRGAAALVRAAAVADGAARAGLEHAAPGGWAVDGGGVCRRRGGGGGRAENEGDNSETDCGGTRAKVNERRQGRRTRARKRVRTHRVAKGDGRKLLN